MDTFEPAPRSAVDVLPASAGAPRARPARPSRRPAPPRRALVLLVLGVLVVVAAAALWATRGSSGPGADAQGGPDLPPGPASLAPEDRPSGDRLALTVPFEGVDARTGAAFSLRLPGTKRVAQSTDPANGQLLTQGLGAPGSALLVVRFDEATSARAAVEALSDGQEPAARVRATAVGREPAWAVDQVLGPRTVVREFRFQHAGAVYGVGILHDPTSGPQSLATGLAALQTFRWTG